MSRYMGAWQHGEPPPHIPKTKSGQNRQGPHWVKPSERKNESGQKRLRRQQGLPAKVAA